MTWILRIARRALGADLRTMIFGVIFRAWHVDHTSNKSDSLVHLCKHFRTLGNYVAQDVRSLPENCRLSPRNSIFVVANVYAVREATSLPDPMEVTV